MRGNALADPTVVGLLQPFIVTYWYGHQDDDPPAEIAEHVFGARRRMDDPDAGHSNVKILLLDADAGYLDLFDSMPGEDTRGPWQESMPRHFAQRLKAARKKLGLSTKAGAVRDLAIPDRQGDERAIRLFVRLDDPGMPAYYAPVVEVAKPEAKAWDALAFPGEARTVQADVLQSCFHHLYPPGVMERQNKRTMYHWRIAKSEGDLTLEPAGVGEDGRRWARLHGAVTLTDEGSDGFSFSGEFSAVLTYDADGDEPTSLRATFEGIYPRRDAQRGGSRRFPITAVFESLPGVRE